jgi:hypothetical protein
MMLAADRRSEGCWIPAKPAIGALTDDPAHRRGAERPAPSDGDRYAGAPGGGVPQGAGPETDALRPGDVGPG